MLLKFDDKRYNFSKKGLKIARLIKLMIDQDLLVPMTEKEENTIAWSFKPSFIDFSGISRKVIVPDKKDTSYKRLNKVKQTKHFFGYNPEDDEIDIHLKELQEVIDSLNLRKHIDISLYYKFSELMQKVMHEFGCYDFVYELSGTEAKTIRDECIFPKIKTINNKPFYSNKKLYYIDLNGAYMSAVKYIPTGKVNEK